MRWSLTVAGAILFAIFCGMGTAWSQSVAQSSAFNPSPKKDARGFIDVWQLRNDVAEVEALQASDNTDGCYQEGGPEEKPLSAEEVKQRALAEETCVEKVRRAFDAYQRIFASFNQSWLPVMLEAMRKGDVVAEVIMRQCDTTSALDRGGLESTCDPDPERRSMAMNRLKEIGFAPAYTDPRAEGKFVHGTRAFTFHRTNHGVWKTDAFAFLRLNRKPQTPGTLTWERFLYSSSSNDLYDGLKNFDVNVNDAIAEIEGVEIDRYLTQDPRWGVFLLHRVGHHEWVPEGMKSTTHILDPSWEGTWDLEKEAENWILPMKPASGRAIITRKGEFMQITIQAKQAREPFKNVIDCTLRYSGGQTYLPELTPSGQAATATILGYFYGAAANRMGNSAFPKPGTFYKDGQNKEAVAPFDPEKRYEQILMQCPNAESDGTGRVRFLLLTNDVLVEFGFWYADHLAVRHYRRRERVMPINIVSGSRDGSPLSVTAIPFLVGLVAK